MPNLEKERIRALEQQIADRDHFISELLASASWKITQPLRWLHARLYRSRSAKALSSSVAPRTENTPELLEAKDALLKLARTSLHAFLASGAELRFSAADDPELSILLVLHNQAELTFRCLSSLLKNAPPHSEIVIVDNGSEDATRELLEQVRGAKIIQNKQNRHFVLGANQAAQAARGKFLLFLNNDSEVLAGSISSALDTLKSDSDIGAVGGKLILPDGTLQEAGSIVWRDGSCVAFGRGEDPFASPFMFQRDVDFCSGAFLMTGKDDFFGAGAFDEAFQPAYYEDADYCLKLHKSGKRVVFDSAAVVIHFEFGSSDSSEAAIQLQVKNRSIFSSKHGEELRSRHVPGDFLHARDRNLPFRRILYIDDRVPHPSRGSGFARAHSIVTGLVRFNCFVTIYPMSYLNEDWSSVYSDIPREVEVILGSGRSYLESFLQERTGYYDFLFVSRPQNMQIVTELRNRRPELFEKLRLIYDAEAIFSTRENPEGAQQELEIGKRADLLLAVSEHDRKIWKKAGAEKVEILGHSVVVKPGYALFEQRAGFLFVGTIHDDASPNADAVRWFVQEIWPILQQRLSSNITFNVAGINHSDQLLQLQQPGVRFIGYHADLSNVFNSARVFVAPSRIAAGLPFKVHDAAAHGVPVVATSVLGEQLGWKDGKELLLADSPQAFAEKCAELYQNPNLWKEIRQNALQAVERDCSPKSFDEKLRSILS